MKTRNLASKFKLNFMSPGTTIALLHVRIFPILAKLDFVLFINICLCYYYEFTQESLEKVQKGKITEFNYKT